MCGIFVMPIFEKQRYFTVRMKLFLKNQIFVIIMVTKITLMLRSKSVSKFLHDVRRHNADFLSLKLSVICFDDIMQRSRVGGATDNDCFSSVHVKKEEMLTKVMVIYNNKCMVLISLLDCTSFTDFILFPLKQHKLSNLIQ